MNNVASRKPRVRVPQPRPEVRHAVRDLLTQSAAFRALPPKTQAQLARDTVKVADYLARPAGAGAGGNESVNFPDFVSSLIKGVFQAIVKASIDQMEAYGKLVAAVAKSLHLFRDESVSESQARNHLTEQFPDLFRSGIRKETLAQTKIRRLANRRQQLLATMMLMGINRIVVTDSKSQAKTR
jgi:hypothetical protein